MNVPEAVFVSPLPGGAMDTKFLMGPYWTQDLGVSLARRRHLWGTFIPPPSPEGEVEIRNVLMALVSAMTLPGGKSRL